MKKVLIYVFAHYIIASIVTDWARGQGRTEEEAQIAGHVAGAATGFFLSSKA